LRTGGLDRDGERGAARALRVQADGQSRGLAHAADQRTGGGRIERACRIVQQHAIHAELGQPPRALHEPAAARGVRVHEARVHAGAGLAHRRDRTQQVLDVVQRVVQPKDVDAGLRGAEDEAADEIGVRGARTDQERASQRHHQGRRRAGLEGADALPRALDRARDRAGEAAAARDLERGIAGAVEILGQSQDPRGRDTAHERLLREQPDRGVDEAGHVGDQARDR
jgi:hypothetical protein